MKVCTGRACGSVYDPPVCGFVTVTWILSLAVTEQLEDAGKVSGLVSVSSESAVLIPFMAPISTLGITVIDLSLHFKMYIWQL